MAKEKERRTAHILYVEQGKTAKEVAELIGCAEKTIGEWVAKYGWKEERSARQASPSKRAGNIKMIITNLSEDRLRLDREIRAIEAGGDPARHNTIREEMSQIDDAVSKWNKTLENIEKEGRVSLVTYLNVMDQIFSSMRNYDAKLFMSTVEFQEHHIHKISLVL
jgi:transposase-like protein